MATFKTIVKWVLIVLAVVLGIGMAFGSWQGHSASNELEVVKTDVAAKATQADLDAAKADIATRATQADLGVVASAVRTMRDDIDALKADVSGHAIDIDALKADIATRATQADLDALRANTSTALATKADLADLGALKTDAEKRFATYGWAKSNLVSKTQAEGFARNSQLDEKASRSSVNVRFDSVDERLKKLEAASSDTTVKVEVK